MREPQVRVGGRKGGEEEKKNKERGRESSHSLQTQPCRISRCIIVRRRRGTVMEEGDRGIFWIRQSRQAAHGTIHQRGTTTKAIFWLGANPGADERTLHRAVSERIPGWVNSRFWPRSRRASRLFRRACCVCKGKGTRWEREKEGDVTAMRPQVEVTLALHRPGPLPLPCRCDCQTAKAPVERRSGASAQPK